MSLKPRKTAPRPPPSESATSALAGVIAHELNNIAVPLTGFAELAGQNAGANESLGNSLEEIKIASARIKSLASDLESLGEMTSLVEPVAIGDCMPGEAAVDQPELPRIDWRCSPATLVAVDRAHARRAIQALAAVIGRTGAPSESLPGWNVGQAPPSTARCAACGGAQARKDHLLVQGFSSRVVPGEMLRDPFGPRAERATRRLALAVLVHSTHRAGGHIILDPAAGSISLALPLA
jgi:hypothetical protein